MATYYSDYAELPLGQVRHWQLGVSKRRFRRVIRELDQPVEKWRVRCQDMKREKVYEGYVPISERDRWVPASSKGKVHNITLWRSGVLTTDCSWHGARCREVRGLWKEAREKARSGDSVGPCPKKLPKGLFKVACELQMRSRFIPYRQPMRLSRAWGRPYALGTWARQAGLWTGGKLSRERCLEVVMPRLAKAPVVYSDLITKAREWKVVRASIHDGVCMVAREYGGTDLVWADIVEDYEGHRLIVMRQQPPSEG